MFNIRFKRFSPQASRVIRRRRFRVQSGIFGFHKIALRHFKRVLGCFVNSFISLKNISMYQKSSKSAEYTDGRILGTQYGTRH